MTGFNHGMVGAIIALSIKQPALAIPIAFISHYPLDTLPHLGFSQEQVLKPKFNRLVKIDFVISIILVIGLALLFPSHILIIWACMVASAISDFVWYFHRKTVRHWPNSLDPFTKLHWHLNNHTEHFYYDSAYFAVLATIILAIRF
jgi:hypothetical protein